MSNAFLPIGSVVTEMSKSGCGDIDQIRYFEISFDPSKKSFGIRYTNSSFLEVSSGTWQGHLGKLPMMIESERSVPPVPANITNQPQHPRTDLSLNAPLEITVNGKPQCPKATRCLYVFYLAQSHMKDHLDWRFSTKQPPFSIAVESEQEPEDAGVPCFRYASGLKYDSAQTPPKVTALSDPITATKLASFVFDNKCFTGTPYNQDKVFRFNIHVEIGSEEHDLGQGDKYFSEWIPIVIDPDVGHPGGGYPPTGP